MYLDFLDSDVPISDGESGVSKFRAPKCGGVDFAALLFGGEHGSREVGIDGVVS